jgi:hypothetical protein
MTTPKQEDRPQLGATFYPGGLDGFDMPELISPAPQRYVASYEIRGFIACTRAVQPLPRRPKDPAYYVYFG